MSNNFKLLVESLNESTEQRVDEILKEFQETGDVEQLDKSLNEIQAIADVANRYIFPIIGKLVDKVLNALKSKPELVKSMMDLFKEVDDADSRRAIQAHKEGDVLLLIALHGAVKHKKEVGRSRADSMGV